MMEEFKDKIVIYGDLFEFNPDRTRLIECGGRNTIQEIGYIAEGVETVSFWYEKHSKTLISMDSISYADALNQELIKIDLPALMLLRGPELSDKVLSAYNEKSILDHLGFQYVTDELSQRFKGTPAEMRIDGLNYRMDLKKREVSQKDSPEKKFIFGPEAIYESSEQFYNTQTKEPVNLTSRIAECPEHVVCFTFPPLKNMDPIGYCQINGYPPSWLVSNFRWNPKSINLPWKALDQTRIPELVRRNQIEQELQGRNKFNVSNLTAKSRPTKIKRNS